jgi:catechol 2,3-dioxygenase-like lactoylglutathione lyase family enzyme
MRGLSLFAIGLISGLAIHAALAQTQNQGIVNLNHVGINVPDPEATVRYYTEVLGFPEAFRVTNENGEIDLVYVQVSENTFVEIQPTREDRPLGINHFGLHVENMDEAIAMFRGRGAEVQDKRLSGGTHAILSNIITSDGIRIELSELPPESFHRQAMERW